MSTESSFTASRGFGGERQDETGLFCLGVRYFDPVIGRFVSPDTETPGSAQVSFNRYAFGNDDPVNYSDSRGHASLWDSVSVATAAAGGFVSGLSTGATKIGAAAVNGVVEVGKTLYDAGGDLVDSAYMGATGRTLNFQHVSALGLAGDQILQNGGTAEDATNATAPTLVANTLTVGFYGYGKGAYSYYETGNPDELYSGAGGLVDFIVAAELGSAYTSWKGGAPAAEPLALDSISASTPSAPGPTSSIVVSLPAPATPPLVVTTETVPALGSGWITVQPGVGGTTSTFSTGLGPAAAAGDALIVGPATPLGPVAPSGDFFGGVGILPELFGSGDGALLGRVGMPDYVGGGLTAPFDPGSNGWSGSSGNAEAAPAGSPETYDEESGVGGSWGDEEGEE